MENKINDIFTETVNGIDVEVNQLKLNCLTSKNNKFHLDSNGNLSVNSLTTVEGFNTPSIDETAICNLIYPVGSIYIGINETNPSTLFGGTWEAFATGQTLVGVDTNQAEFNPVLKTGGAKNHSLTVAQLASHNHGFSGTTSTNGNHRHQSRGWWSSGSGTQAGMANSIVGSDPVDNSSLLDAGNHNHSFSGTTASTGSTEPHNNLQPYITVYMFKRTA